MLLPSGGSSQSLTTTLLRLRSTRLPQLTHLTQHQFHHSSRAKRAEDNKSAFYTQEDGRNNGHATLWPDPHLGVFSPTDPRFRLPGQSGSVKPAQEAGATSSEPTPSEPQPPFALLNASDLLSRPTNLERHCAVLYTAHDYIKFGEGAEEELCTDMLDASSFPGLPGAARVVAESRTAPELLLRQLQPLFPGRNLENNNLTVVTLSIKTEEDMSCWSEAMEEEREELTGQFVAAAKEICARLKDEGHWADFIDPSSGTPFYSDHANTTLFETDERYRLLGFRIEDLGCCKVISHRDFGRRVFVGTVFTDAHNSTGVVRDIFEDLKMAIEEK